MNAWENQAPLLGRDAGFFKKQGLAVTAFGTHGAGAALQAVLSGTADIAVGVDIAAALRAFAKGGAIRILLPGFTGASDLYWYVKSDSPLGELRQAAAANTIAYSTEGASTQDVLAELGIKARPVAAGSPAATLMQVMAGKIDIGWGRAPFGLKEVAESKIRIVGRGADVASLRQRTLRVIVVSTDALEKRKDAMLRFVRAYREAVDWLYAEPGAIKSYAETIRQRSELIKESIGTYQPRTALQTETVSGLDETMRDAVKEKILDAPLSREQLAALLQIPPRR